MIDLALALAFCGSAMLVWLAGRPLVRATAILSRRYGLGEALGGMLLLAVITDLPELAIVVSGAVRGDVALAVGNLLGGTAAQMMVLVALDRAAPPVTPSLASRSASPTLIAECGLVVLLLAAVAVGPMLAALGRVGPLTLPDIAVPALWVGGLVLVGRLRPLAAGATAGTAPPGSDTAVGAATFATFALAALATFAGGVGLEAIGDRLADRLGIAGVVFGATVLAVATSLPELATGWAAAKAGEDELAVSDIVGGNAVLPVLLTPATLIAGVSAYAAIDATSVFVALVGIAMTVVYAVALIVRPRRRVFGVGPECVAMSVLYGLGIVGLVAGS